jgi:hypothetical protein
MLPPIAAVVTAPERRARQDQLATRSLAPEIDSEPGLSPEGRLALAEDAPADPAHRIGKQAHPNGAIKLIGSVLCVPDADLNNFVRRNTRYLQRPACSDGPLRVFDLSNSKVLITPNAALVSTMRCRTKRRQSFRPSSDTD